MNIEPINNLELLHAVNGAINELKTKDNASSQTMAVIDELRNAQRMLQRQINTVHMLQRQINDLCGND